jgi:hypothetical protein
MSGRTERTIWRMIAEGKLKHTRDSAGRVWIEERNVPSQRTSGKDAIIANLREQVRELQQRLEAAERGQARRHAAPAPRSEAPIRPASVPAIATPSAATGGELPETRRQRGFWVQNHGGPKGSSVRTGWEEILEWSSIGDALAGMRQHEWEPRECNDAACGCHALLGVGILKS